MNQAAPRQPINLGAVIGVVFVFLVGVIIWVLVEGASGESTADSPTTTAELGSLVLPTTTTGTGPELSTPGTSPVPLPSIVPSTLGPGSTAPSTSSSTVPTSSLPSSTDPAEPPSDGGDLGISGHPIVEPDCTGAYITVIASAVGSDVNPAAVEGVLDSYPDSRYLRTDTACPSLTQQIDGEPIYVVFFGPYPAAGDACAARDNGTPDAYVRVLSNDLPADHQVDCDE